jgi:hypothetical protein
MNQTSDIQAQITSFKKDKIFFDFFLVLMVILAFAAFFGGIRIHSSIMVYFTLVPICGFFYNYIMRRVTIRALKKLQGQK